MRRSLQLLLFSQGYDVRAYPSGAGLADDPEALRSDCLVADLLIPDGDAVALLKDLRRAGWHGPAILISGHLDERGIPARFVEPDGTALNTAWQAAVGESVCI